MHSGSGQEKKISRYLSWFLDFLRLCSVPYLLVVSHALNYQNNYILMLIRHWLQRSCRDGKGCFCCLWVWRCRRIDLGGGSGLWGQSFRPCFLKIYFDMIQVQFADFGVPLPSQADFTMFDLNNDGTLFMEEWREKTHCWGFAFIASILTTIIRK